MSDDFKILGQTESNQTPNQDAFKVLGTNRPSDDFAVVDSTQSHERKPSISVAESYLAPLVKMLPRGADKPSSLNDNELLISIDEKTKKAVNWTRFINPAQFQRHYVVFLEGRQTCSPRNFRFERLQGQSIELDIWFEIHGPIRSKERQFVESLARGRLGFQGDIIEPHEIFLRFVEETILHSLHQDVGEGTALSPAALDSLARTLAEKASSQLGLQLVAGVTFPSYDGILYFSTPSFKTFISNEPIQFRYEIGLMSAEEHGHASQTYIPPVDLRRNIDTEVKRWLAGSPTIDDIHKSPERVRAGLEGHINQFVNQYGLSIQHLALHTNFSLIATIDDTFEHDVSCRVQPDDTQVSIRHQLDTDLSEVAKYQQAGITNFENWVTDILNRCTQKELFGHTYTDLLLAFDPIKQRIGSAVRQQAADVGLVVRQLISIPNLPLRKLIDEGFRLEITRGGDPEGLEGETNGSVSSSKDSPKPSSDDEFQVVGEGDNGKTEEVATADETVQAGSKSTSNSSQWGNQRDEGFLTKDSRVRFPCRVNVEGRLRNLQSLRDYLTPTWDWESEMKRLINVRVESVTRNLLPQQLFLEFEESMDDGASPGDQIKASIEEAFGQQPPHGYDAECYTIILSPLETQFSKTHDILTSRPKTLGFEVTPLDNALEKISFNITFSIEGIANNAEAWGKFQNSARHLSDDDFFAKVGESIVNVCRQNLQTLGSSKLRYRDIREVEDLKASVISPFAKRSVAKAFGLDISIDLLERGTGRLELKAAEDAEEFRRAQLKMRKNRINAIVERQAMLLEQKKDYEESGFPGDEIKLDKTVQDLNALEEELKALEDQSELGNLRIEDHSKNSSQPSDYSRLTDNTNTTDREEGS
tara:strand:- start:6934 stop:9552 length:2619 start_codon:yes stop_codon:yes gene_type:complete